MSTGLSGEQLDALRAEIYAAMLAAGDEFNQLCEQPDVDNGIRAASKAFGQSEAFGRALLLLDKARWEAARSKVGSKR